MSTAADAEQVAPLRWLGALGALGAVGIALGCGAPAGSASAKPTVAEPVVVAPAEPAAPPAPTPEPPAPVPSAPAESPPPPPSEPAPPAVCPRKVLGQAAPPGYRSCREDADCTVVATGVCPPCGRIPLGRARAIAKAALDELGNPYQPRGVGCPQCATGQPIDFSAACVKQSCALVQDACGVADEP